MPTAHPVELRKRVVDAYFRAEGSYAVIGVRFGVGEASVNRWVQLFRRTGSLEPMPQGAQPGDGRKLFPEHEEFLLETLEAVPDSTAVELHAALEEVYELGIHYDTVRVALRRLGYTRKRGL